VAFVLPATDPITADAPHSETAPTISASTSKSENRNFRFLLNMIDAPFDLLARA
jgi:hypothetical protein